MKTIEELTERLEDNGHELTEEQTAELFDCLEGIEEKEREISEDEYDEMLDEIYPEVKIGAYSFSPSQILKELDPIAYRCGMSDMEDGEPYFEYDGQEYDTFDEALEQMIEDLF